MLRTAIVAVILMFTVALTHGVTTQQRSSGSTKVQRSLQSHPKRHHLVARQTSRLPLTAKIQLRETAPSRVHGLRPPVNNQPQPDQPTLPPFFHQTTTLKFQPQQRAATSSSQKTKESINEPDDILKNKGWKKQLDDNWNLRLSVDSHRPSEIGPRPNYGFAGLGTIGPTLTWERKF